MALPVRPPSVHPVYNNAQYYIITTANKFAVIIITKTNKSEIFNKECIMSINTNPAIIPAQAFPLQHLWTYPGGSSQAGPM